MASQKICSVENCGKPVCYRGLCSAHIQRLKRRGTTDRDPNWVRSSSPEESAALAKARRQREYLKHKGAYKARAKARYWEKRDEILAKPKTEAQVIKARDRATQWRLENPERKREADKRFYEENPAIVRSYKAKRRARSRLAVPECITDAQIDAIVAIYEEAERMCASGIPHEVDHIVPLAAGEHISGLHVPWNLRVLTRDENNRRPRKMTRAMLDVMAEELMAELRAKGLAR